MSGSATQPDILSVNEKADKDVQLDTGNIDEKGVEEFSDVKGHWQEIRREANVAEEEEHQMSLWQSCKLCRKVSPSPNQSSG